MKYIHNSIIKPIMVSILHYTNRVSKMNNISKYLTQPLNKGDMFDESGWIVRNHESTEDEIRIATKEGLTQFMQDDMEEKDKEYLYFTYEELCNLLYILKKKYNSNRDYVYIKRLSNQKFVLDADSDSSPRVTHKKNNRTVIVPARN